MSQHRGAVQARAAGNSAAERIATAKCKTGRSPLAQPSRGAGEIHTKLAEDFDRRLHAAIGRFSGGLSLLGLSEAWADWAAHLALSPGKHAELATKAARKWVRLLNHVAESCDPDCEFRPCIEPLVQDTRFAAKEWQTLPYSLLYQSFLLSQQWWHNATTSVSGVKRESEALVEFFSRQWLDMVAPSNFPWTNPEVLNRTLEERGANLVRGYSYLIEDFFQAAGASMPERKDRPKPGREMARTPGQVVYRNRLIELIQYRPQTATVHTNPVLIVPAWIMKYYVLDLQPRASLVEYLVGKGHTVFCISWKNPDEDDRDLSLDDYRRLGVMAALDAIGAINGPAPVNVMGYCLGGTLALIAAATMAREGDRRLNTLGLLAAQGDFSEAGELSVFVNDSQLALTEAMMDAAGYLDQRAMAGAFRMLRSRDLIWSRVVREYLLGQRAAPSAMDAWNHDATRMPARMHGEYLRFTYLDNDLAEGRYLVDGDRIYLEDIAVPAFILATERDHVAPWNSVFKLVRLLSGDIEFVLASGGHNTGVIAAPGNPKASYRKLSHRQGDNHPDPDEWVEQGLRHDGSWWPEWIRWLSSHGGPLREPPSLGAPQKGYAPLCEAPGTYVMET